MTSVKPSSWVLGALLFTVGCGPSSSERIAEMNREWTLEQIEELRQGKRIQFLEPSPSLVAELVTDERCAPFIVDLGFVRSIVDTADPRLGRLRDLPNLRVVFFYCSDADSFLPQIAGMTSIESVLTESAHLSVTGMSAVASFPNLKKLTLYGCGGGDAGLAVLEGHKSLEELSIIHTKVTDNGLASLQSFPKLMSVVLSREAGPENYLTDAGLKHLRGLQQLEKLELSGGWASEGAIDELREQLPECDIQTEGVH